MNAFDKTYQEMLKRIMKEGVTEVNKRTGHEVKAIPGLHFSHDIGRDGFPLLTRRPPQIPSTPPTALKSMLDIESALSPHNKGTKLPMVEPTIIPPITRDFLFIE